MKSAGLFFLCTLLCWGAGSPARAGAAASAAPLRLRADLGAAVAVPLIGPMSALGPCQTAGGSLVSPAAPALQAVLPAPSVLPALAPAPLPPVPVDASPARAPAPALAGLEDAARGLTADQAKGGQQSRALLAGFFDAAAKPAGAAVSAPETSGLPQASIPAGYLPLPIAVQETNYSCGAASALSVLKYWQAYAGSESSLYELLGTRPKDGTPPEGLARGLVKLGLKAEVKEGMTLGELRAALGRGDSVILDIQAWREDQDTPWSQRWEDGHYTVLIGMDEHYAYLMDPSTPERYTYLPLAELLDRWHDYEDRDGQIRRYRHMGILAHGAKPLPRPAEPPSAPARID